MAANSKTVTIWGRLSFPTLTAQEAYALSQKGQYPVASVADAAPSFQVLVNQAQWEKFKNHCINEFLPYCAKQHAAGEKRDVLSPAEVTALIEGMEGDLDAQVYNTPAKAVGEKTAPLVPECVAAIKAIGAKGVDLEVKAIVNDESELAVPDPDLMTFPVIKPINQTVHTLYPGCAVAVTLNLYAYHNGKHPGFSAGATTVVFKTDMERIGGGVSVDEDEIFLD